MPQYAVLIFEREIPDELPPDVLAAHGALPGRVAEAGGRILAGLALQESSTATAIRGELLTDGPFIETKEALAGVFVLDARDLDHALALASNAHNAMARNLEKTYFENAPKRSRRLVPSD